MSQCAGDELSDSLLKANPQAASNTLSQLLTDMRSFAVIPVATGVSRLNCSSYARNMMNHFVRLQDGCAGKLKRAHSPRSVNVQRLSTTLII